MTKATGIERNKTGCKKERGKERGKRGELGNERGNEKKERR